VREGGSKLVPPEEQGERPRKVRLFGLQITDTTLVEAAAWILDRAANQIPTQVSFLNAHCVNVMRKDAVYTEALASSDRILADGSGLAIAARAFGVRLRENVNGTDLFSVLCAMAARSGARIYLMGGRPGIAAAAAERMERAFPAERSGHRVQVVGDGAEAVAALEAGNFDLVLLDLQMPVMDGFEAVQRIRGLAGDAGRVPVLALSAQVLPEALKRVRESGFDGHIAKPVFASDLNAAIAAVIERRAVAEIEPLSEARAASIESPPPATPDFRIIDTLEQALSADDLEGVLERLSIDTASILHAIGECLRTGDSDRLAENAHKLSGILGQFGCGELAADAQQIEHAPEASSSMALGRKLVDRAPGFVQALRDRVNRAAA
jgi:UDP-N-acetyl-D-mannosaminuronic acid transferase (WecB/TagA/CpsF family)